jgi:leucyl aminopeptidase (aminopeptidase T)
LARNAQVFVLRGITEEMLLSEMINVDFAALRRETTVLAQRLTHGSSLRVTTSAGTDLTLGIQGREAKALAGGTGPGRFGGPRSGEAAIAPVEDSSHGLLVIEHSMDNIGLLDRPLELTVVDGKVTSVSGGRSADELRRLLDASDANATNLAEFAIGTNPAARLTGNLATDKKVRGSAHVAVGDNVSLGGVVRSDIHLDGMLLKPTVLVDGATLVENGVLVFENA